MHHLVASLVYGMDLCVVIGPKGSRLLKADFRKMSGFSFGKQQMGDAHRLHGY
uniref:Uncharacterized protein n=1 Tax=Parascaris univalens TaxID=6257 RepID=A0A915C2N4_PARUN